MDADEERRYHAVIIPVHVGSRGMVEMEGFERLRLYLMTTSERQWRSLLIAITKETIEMSQSLGGKELGNLIKFVMHGHLVITLILYFFFHCMLIIIVL